MSDPSSGTNEYSLQEYPTFWVTNALSVLGCFFMFSRGILLRDSLTPGLTLVLLLSICGFLESSLSLIPSFFEINDAICQPIGFIKAIAVWESLLICLVISRLVYLTLGNYGNDQLANACKKWIFFSIVTSLVIAILPLFNVAGLEYSSKYHYCHPAYEPDFTKNYAKIIAFFTTRGLIYILTLVSLIAVYRRSIKFYRSLPEHILKAHNMSAAKLLIYPVAQMIVYTPNALFLFVVLFTEVSEPWFVFVTNCLHMAGFVNSLVYGGQFRIERRKHTESTGSDVSGISMEVRGISDNDISVNFT